MAKPNLSDKALEPRPVQGRGCRAAEVIIDDDDLRRMPTKLTSAISQRVL
jgi:hypothetical protein